MRPDPVRPDLVIFDCDGVIVDSEPPTFALLAEEMNAHGGALSADDIERDFIGGTMASVAQKARARGIALPEGWEREIYPKMFARLSQGVALMPGVAGVLDALDTAGVPYCIGSNGPEAKMEITLGQHPGVYARLKGRIFSAHTHGVAKPDPGLFLIAARGFGIDPARCAVIEDSPTGARAARGAGMRCFGYAPHDDGARLTTEGAEVFTDMAELPALLGL